MSDSPPPGSAGPRTPVSDARRDAALAILDAARADGRLSSAEHQERYRTAALSRFEDELTPLISDLNLRPWNWNCEPRASGPTTRSPTNGSSDPFAARNGTRRGRCGSVSPSLPVRARARDDGPRRDPLRLTHVGTGRARELSGR
ncbi:DUF1707 domain-containing protein [Dietzia aerolata]|uniref:DUF1707 domain-containing protein n=1 Tax=Dietzia aerolata TaxID=595984 RepID=UPI003624F6F5